jgi:hypothetical protein
MRKGKQGKRASGRADNGGAEGGGNMQQAYTALPFGLVGCGVAEPRLRYGPKAGGCTAYDGSTAYSAAPAGHAQQQPAAATRIYYTVAIL